MVCQGPEPGEVAGTLPWGLWGARPGHTLISHFQTLDCEIVSV